MAGIIIQGITPNLKIQGANQAFKFGWDTLPPPIGAFSLENAYIPIISSNSFTNFNFKNNTLSGFRFTHETSTTDTIGQLKLQSFIGDSPTGTDILTFGNDGSINFISPLVISSDLNMNGFKLRNVDTPVLGTDGVNKDYADSLLSGGTVTLTGAVTGTGSVGSSIATTLSPQLTLPFIQLSFDWANPSSQTPYILSNKLNDAFTTKTMFEEIVADDAITADRRVWRHVWGIGASVPSPSPFNNYADYALQFAPSSNSGVGQFNVYSINLNTVDGASFNFGVPVGMGGYRLKDLATPIALTDGANKGYIDNKTWVTSQITDYTTATNTLIADATIAISKLAGFPNTTTTYLAGDGTWSNLSTAINSNFGSSVTLPFNQLSFNWAYTAGSNPANYELANNLSDNQISKNFKYRIATNDISTREWNHNYNLIGNSDLNGLYEINYKVSSTTFTPLSISIYPFATSQNLMSITVPVDMGGFEVRNALNPTTPQSLATKNYIDTRTIPISQLTGYPANTTTFLRGDGTWSNQLTSDFLVSGQIKFPNAFNVNKISFYDNTGNPYNQSGIGYDGLGTSYNTLAGLSHNFFIGASSPVPLRVTPIGLIIQELKTVDSDYRRIMFLDETENLHQIYNIGIKTLDGTNHSIHSQVASFQAAFTWGYGLTTVSSYELMRLSNDALTINSAKVSITDSVNLNQWDLKANPDATFSFNKSTDATNNFNLTASTLSTIASLVNTNANANTYFRAGTTNDTIQLGYDGSNGYSYINVDGASNDRLAFRANGTGFAALLKSGLFGIGTITPTLGKIQINGGTQNIASEETALHVRGSLNSIKIELENTAVGGKSYEINSTSTGIFDVFDRTGSTSRLAISSTGVVSTTGNLGIGTTTANAPLQFSNNIGNRKIVLFETTNNDHQFTGFGLNTTELRYQVSATTNNHIFYAGTSTTTSNEVARITGTGTIYARRVSGMISMQNNVIATTITTAGVFVKVAGTTTSSNLNAVLAPISNRITSNTPIAHIAKIDCSFSANHSGGNNDEITFALYRNGVQLGNTLISTQYGDRLQQLSISAIVSMPTLGDFIELWATHSVSNRTITVKHLTAIYSAT